MTRALITIQFLDWWQAGTGKSGEGDADMIAYRDQWGCPALPGSQLKGILREAARDRLGWTEDAITLYFGEATNKDKPGFATQGSIAFPDHATLSSGEQGYFHNNSGARSALFSMLHATAIDADTGTAKDRSLRLMEVAVPMTLTGEVEWVGSSGPPADWIEKLDALCVLTPAFGKQTHDGLGRAIAGCQAVESNAEDTSQETPPSPSHNLLPGDAITKRCIVLELTPNAPAIFSRDASTEGAHATLNGPTGAALLGWAAQKCYNELDAPTAFAVFHSGKVRFSDAVRMVPKKQGHLKITPLALDNVSNVRSDADQPSFLNPATLFAPKHGLGNTVLGRKAFKEANGQGIQAEAVKRKWVTLTGDQAPVPRTHHRLRTAMSAGTAEDGKLFGYAAVLPGQTKFRATIECDTTLDDKTWEKIVAAFDKATLRIGRASSSGNGGSYTCSVSEAGSPWPAHVEITGDVVSFWLLSDAQLVDKWGNPKFDPEPSDFGLGDAGWTQNRAETAISTRRIWPWNRTYNSRDMEISVIEAGSVVSFTRTAEADVVAPKPRIGIGQERGFGRVAVLGEFTFGVNSEPDKAKPPKESESNLTRWAQAKAERSKIEDRSKWADEKIQEVKAKIDRMNGDGPSATQWSGVYDVIDYYRKDEFATKLEVGLKNTSWRANYVGLDNWVRDELFATPEEGVSFEQRRHEIRRVVKVARTYKPEQRP